MNGKDCSVAGCEHYHFLRPSLNSQWSNKTEFASVAESWFLNRNEIGQNNSQRNKRQSVKCWDCHAALVASTRYISTLLSSKPLVIPSLTLVLWRVYNKFIAGFFMAIPMENHGTIRVDLLRPLSDARSLISFHQLLYGKFPSRFELCHLSWELRMALNTDLN